MLSNEAIHQQVENLLSQMTLEEKAAQMVQVPYTVVGREEALRWAKLGAGSFLHVLGCGFLDWILQNWMSICLVR